MKTFKRDDLRAKPMPDARTALGQIPGWIEDDNEVHPHSALKMRSPRDFFKDKNTEPDGRSNAEHSNQTITEPDNPRKSPNLIIKTKTIHRYSRQNK